MSPSRSRDAKPTSARTSSLSGPSFTRCCRERGPFGAPPPARRSPPILRDDLPRSRRCRPRSRPRSRGFSSAASRRTRRALRVDGRPGPRPRAGRRPRGARLVERGPAVAVPASTPRRSPNLALGLLLLLPFLVAGARLARDEDRTDFRAGVPEADLPAGLHRTARFRERRQGRRLLGGVGRGQALRLPVGPRRSDVMTLPFGRREPSRESRPGDSSLCPSARGRSRRDADRQAGRGVRHRRDRARAGRRVLAADFSPDGTRLAVVSSTSRKAPAGSSSRWAGRLRDGRGRLGQRSSVSEGRSHVGFSTSPVDPGRRRPSAVLDAAGRRGR